MINKHRIERTLATFDLIENPDDLREHVNSIVLAAPRAAVVESIAYTLHAIRLDEQGTLCTLVGIYVKREEGAQDE